MWSKKAIEMGKKLKFRFPTLKFKGKLIFVFTIVSLIPIISLIFVSNFIIVQSIHRWESVSTKLRALSVLPIGDKAMEVASDSDFLMALEKEYRPLEMTFHLPEDYIVLVYDTAGNLMFSSVGDKISGLNVATLEDIGLPFVRDFLPGMPISAKEIRVKNNELVLSGVMCQSLKDGRTLGIVAVGQLIPARPSIIGSEAVIGILIFTAILVFLIALWISSFIAREITEPIQKLVEGTREVASGNLDYKVNIQTSDEVGMLADSFDRMTVRLRSNEEELKRAEKLAAWREVAQKLAHEIKNPLTPIQLSAERLRRRYHSRPEGYGEILEECTDTIVNEVIKVRSLLDEFSRLAKLPEVKPVPTDINAIIDKSLKLYGELPENIQVQAEYAQDLPLAFADPGQMEQAFFNVIKNAIEAMVDGGKLILTTRLVSGEASKADNHEKHIEAEFANTGPSISEESMQKLFTPHFSTKKGGMGLGLAIVKKIITDHGGDITVKSEDGEGVTFIFMIPLAGENL